MSKDTIYRQDAINAVKIGALSAATIYGRTDEGSTALYETVRAIKALPSAQAEPQLTVEDIETIRIHLNAIKGNLCNQRRYKEAEEYEEIIKRLTSLPSAQPKITLESAIDYLHSIGWMQEHDRILEEPQWIPCSEKLPEQDVEVIVTNEWGNVEIAQLISYFDGHGETLTWKTEEYYYDELNEVIAWMPLPKPYREENDE